MEATFKLLSKPNETGMLKGMGYPPSTVGVVGQSYRDLTNRKLINDDNGNWTGKVSLRDCPVYTKLPNNQWVKLSDLNR